MVRPGLFVLLFVGGWAVMTVAMMLPTTLPLITAFHRGNMDLRRLLTSVFDRVTDQIEEYLMQACRIGDDPNGDGAVVAHAQVQPFLSGPRGHELDDVLQDLGREALYVFHLEATRFDFGYIQDVIDELK